MSYNILFFIDENQITIFSSEILIFIFLNFTLLFSLYLIKKITYFNLFINVNIYILLYLYILFFSINIYMITALETPVDYFNFFIKNILIWFFLIFLFFIRKNTKLLMTYEFLILINIILLSLIMLLFIKNFITLLIILELYTYSSYIIITSKVNSLLSTEGGLKYFIINSLSSGIFITGICIIYWCYGSIDFFEISEIENYYNIYFIGLGFILLLLGLVLKIGMAPFHFWYLDSYQELDFWFLALLGILPKLVICIILLQFNIYFNLVSLYGVKQFFYLCGLCSALAGNLTVFVQLNFKRLLLFYAIQGNAFVALLFVGGCVEQWEALILYLIFYSIAYLNLALYFMCFKQWNRYNELYHIYNFFNFIKTNHMYSWNFLLALFNLLSIPPLFFFGTKLFVLASLSNYIFYIIAFILIINTITIFVYLRILHIMFFYNTNDIIFILPLTYDKALILSLITLLNSIGLLLSQPYILYLSNNWI
jgi:proton-translocating NADH-quinone oxidoreductase chain N